MKPGHAIAGYTLEELLGEGAMGEVWRATQGNLQRPVALKRMKAAAEDHADGLPRFRREMRIQAALLHPNLVTVFDGGVHEGSPFLVMELVEGGSLRELIDREPIPPARVLALVGGIAAATAYLHEKGVIHRDIKPANILLDARGVPKVTDFGLSRSTNATALTRADSAVGTPAYLPPEVLAGDPAAPASDVYAIGILAYEMFSGKSPYTSRSFPELAREIASGRRIPLAQAAPGLHPALCRFVEDCLAVAPGARPTASDIEHRVRELTEVTRTGAPGLPSGRGGRALVLAACAGAILATGLFLAARQPVAPVIATSPGPMTVPASPAAPATLQSQVLEKYRARLAAARPVVHLAPTGTARGSLDRLIRFIANEGHEGTPDENAIHGVVLVFPTAAPAPATLRIAGPAPAEVEVNGTALTAGPEGSWTVDPALLRAGINGIRLSRPGPGTPRIEVVPAGPVDLETRAEPLPPPTTSTLAAIPEIGDESIALDHITPLLKVQRVLEDQGDHPALRLFAADCRTMLVRERLHFNDSEGVLMMGQAVGARTADDRIADSHEELLAKAIQDLESVLARYPRAPYAWMVLSRALGMAGLEAEAFQASRFGVAIEPTSSFNWSSQYHIVDDQIVRGRARPERILEAIEACRVAQEIDGRPTQEKSIAWLSRNLSPGDEPVTRR